MTGYFTSPQSRDLLKDSVKDGLDFPTGTSETAQSSDSEE